MSQEDHDNTLFPTLIHCRAGYLSDNETGLLSSSSPFVGRYTQWNGEQKMEQTLIYRWMDESGCELHVAGSMCQHLKLPVSDDITDMWVRMVTSCPLMAHIIPARLHSDERIQNLVRMLHVGGVKWNRADMLAVVRTVLIGMDYDRIEARLVIRNEYDDQSYSDRATLIPFLLRSSQKTGMGGYSIEEGDGYETECIGELFYHVSKMLHSSKSFSTSGLHSFVYDIAADTAEFRDIAVGMSVGRE
jgi:hypothetical protein